MFHSIDLDRTFNDISPEYFITLKSEIQVIDDSLIDTQMKTLMKENLEIKFTEPQSMNYDKKITQAYIEYEQKRQE